MKFRKKPVEVDAWIFLGSQIDNEGTPNWVREVSLWKAGENQLGWRGLLAIKTLEGIMIASPGDWIIRGVKGEVYPCKPDIFAATYEQVSERREPFIGELQS